MDISYDENKLQNLLQQKIERAILSERERHLLELIDNGKITQLHDMKKIFSDEKTNTCPFCFQQVTEQNKKNLVCSIEKVLSKEVDIHKENLKKCVITELNLNFTDIDVLNSIHSVKCKNIIEQINKEILYIQETITKKINHPYTPITNFKSKLQTFLEEYELNRIELQKEINKYNDAAKQIESLKNNLSNDNAAIAHYEIAEDNELYYQALDEQRKADKALENSNNKLEISKKRT